MQRILKTAAATGASLALVAVGSGSAMASDGHDGHVFVSEQSNIIKIGKYGELSKSHKIAWVRIKVVCSEDVTSAILAADLTQVVAGAVQRSTGVVASIDAFECSGEEEIVYVPVRRPTDGFKWVKGTARVNEVRFDTWSPTAYDENELAGRTITLR